MTECSEKWSLDDVKKQNKTKNTHTHFPQQNYLLALPVADKLVLVNPF